MKTTVTPDEKLAQMTFAMVYPLYKNKIEKKGRTEEELHQVLEWFTGYAPTTLQHLIYQNATLETFFMGATLPAKAPMIVGTICGIRIETIENPLTKKIRMLDKLVDELAKGKSIQKILEN